MKHASISPMTKQNSVPGASASERQQQQTDRSDVPTMKLQHAAGEQKKHNARTCGLAQSRIQLHTRPAAVRGQAARQQPGHRAAAGAAAAVTCGYRRCHGTCQRGQERVVLVLRDQGRQAAAAAGTRPGRRLPAAAAAIGGVDRDLAGSRQQSARCVVRV